MIALYKPWLKCQSEIMVPYASYKIALQNYMCDKYFPRSIILDILQCKINLDERVDLDEGCDFSPENVQDQEEEWDLVGVMDNELILIATSDGEVDGDIHLGDFS